jgi:hypothetical protein
MLQSRHQNGMMRNKDLWRHWTSNLGNECNMIRSYGLHWRLDRVVWGRQKSAGSLWGAASKSKRAMPVDFRQQRGIYALYADYELVYVGQTGGGAGNRLLNRLRSHRRDHLSERWNRFSWFGIHWVTLQHKLSADAANVSATVQEALNILEATATAIAEPRLNLQRGKWDDATQYYQWYEELEEEEDEEEAEV